MHIGIREKTTDKKNSVVSAPNKISVCYATCFIYEYICSSLFMYIYIYIYGERCTYNYQNTIQMYILQIHIIVDAIISVFGCITVYIECTLYMYIHIYICIYVCPVYTPVCLSLCFENCLCVCASVCLCACVCACGCCSVWFPVGMLCYSRVRL